jgi:hypothetical protein
MSFSRVVSHRILFVVLAFACASASFAADKKQPPPPPAHATVPSPAVTNEYIHKEFGDNCTIMADEPQFVGDLDGDGIDDLVIAARCKNPLADQSEYAFRVTDPFDTALGYGNVKVTSGFASDDPERKGICLLIVHGVGPEAWRSDKPKPKFVLINIPFKTLTVKKLTTKKKTLLGVYMEEKGEGEATASVVFWDGKKYRYEVLGSDLE